MEREKIESGLTELMEQLNEKAQEEGIQLIVLAGKTVKDEQGRTGLQVERSTFLDSDVDAEAAGFLGPVVEFIDVYIGEIAPTEELVSQIMDTLIVRKLQNATQEEVGEMLRKVAEAASDETN